MPVRRELLQGHDLRELLVGHREYLLGVQAVHRGRHLLVLEPARHVVYEILRVQLVVLLHLSHELLLPPLRRALAELVARVRRLLVAVRPRFLVATIVAPVKVVLLVLGVVVLVVDVVAAVVHPPGPRRRERVPELREPLVPDRRAPRAVHAAFADQGGDLLVEIAKDGFFEFLLVLVGPSLVVLLVVHLGHEPVVLLGVELLVEVSRRDGLGAGETADAGDLRHLSLNLLALQVFQSANLRLESFLLGEFALLALAPLVAAGRVLPANGPLDAARVRDDVGAVRFLEAKVILGLEFLRLLNLLFRAGAVPAADDVELGLVLLPLLVHDKVAEERLLLARAVLRLLGVEVFAVSLLSLVSHALRVRVRVCIARLLLHPQAPRGVGIGV